MSGGSTNPAALSGAVRSFYTRTLVALNGTGIPFLVGGAYALQRYTGVERHTKDFDLYVRPGDLERILDALKSRGCRTEVTFSHWLAKAYRGDHFFDIIYSSGNGLGTIDDDWFSHGVSDTVLDVPVRLVPVEELIWHKAFVMERERFDGADIAHLLRARGRTLDWPRLLGRFEGAMGRLLLVHLILFGYIYPGDRESVPAEVIRDLIDRLDRPDGTLVARGGELLCRGTLLSREQYLPDIGWWGYRDARLQPDGPLTAEQIAHWTAAIARKA
jgi:hypothetical protein